MLLGNIFIFFPRLLEGKSQLMLGDFAKADAPDMLGASFHGSCWLADRGKTRLSFVEALDFPTGLQK